MNARRGTLQYNRNSFSPAEPNECKALALLPLPSALENGPRHNTDMRFRSEVNSNTPTISYTSTRPRNEMTTRLPSRARNTTPRRRAACTNAASSGEPA
jgi:hypothetical protein